MKKPDIILTPSPPLTSGIISILLARIKGSKSIYNVQEIYPDLLINHGLTNPLIIKFFRSCIFAVCFFLFTCEEITDIFPPTLEILEPDSKANVNLEFDLVLDVDDNVEVKEVEVREVEVEVKEVKEVIKETEFNWDDI